MLSRVQGMVGVEAGCEAREGVGLLDKAGGIVRLGMDNAVEGKVFLDKPEADGRNWRSVYV